MNMNVSLPEELANFVKDKVSSGRYGSSSEVVREALRLMEKTERGEAEKLEWLRRAWQEGVDSGDAGEVNFTALKKEARARTRRREASDVSRVLFTARAREDLLDIWLYVAKHNSEAVADRIYDSIEQSCRLLKDHPQLGRARPEIQPEARSIVVERWLALYRTTEHGVQILRVVDGARDLSAIEWSPE